MIFFKWDNIKCFNYFINPSRWTNQIYNIINIFIAEFFWSLNEQKNIASRFWTKLFSHTKRINRSASQLTIRSSNIFGWLVILRWTNSAPTCRRHLQYGWVISIDATELKILYMSFLLLFCSHVPRKNAHRKFSLRLI